MSLTEPDLADPPDRVSPSQPAYGVAVCGHLWAHIRSPVSVQAAHSMHRSPGRPTSGRFSQSAFFLQAKQVTSLLKLAQKAYPRLVTRQRQGVSATAPQAVSLPAQ